MIRYLLILLFTLLLSCNAKVKKNNYDKISDKYTKYTYQYKDFFKGKITLEAICVTDEVKNALKRDMEKNNLKKDNIPFPTDKNYPVFLVAFYHYDNKLNILNRKNSIWSITLNLNGKKYHPSEIKRIYENNYRVFNYYFKENQRFSRFYLIEFKDIKLSDMKGKVILIFSTIKENLKLLWNFQ